MSGIRAGKFGGNLAREGSNFIEVVPSNQSQRVEDLGACAGLSGASVVRIVMTTDRVTQVVNALGLSGTEASCRRPVRRTRRRYQSPEPAEIPAEQPAPKLHLPPRD